MARTFFHNGFKGLFDLLDIIFLHGNLQRGFSISSMKSMGWNFIPLKSMMILYDGKRNDWR
jgi:hypothetical protein